MSLDDTEAEPKKASNTNPLFRHIDAIGGVLTTIAECDESNKLDNYEIILKIDKVNDVLDAKSFEEMLNIATLIKDFDREEFVKWFMSDLVELIADFRATRLKFNCRACDYDVLKAISLLIASGKYSLDLLILVFKRYKMYKFSSDIGRNCILHALIHITKNMDEIDKVFELESALMTNLVSSSINVSYHSTGVFYRNIDDKCFPYGRSSDIYIRYTDIYSHIILSNNKY